MKKVFLLIAVTLLTATAYAGNLVYDQTGKTVQTFAPDGTATTTLTVVRTAADFSSRTLWSIYTPASTTCYYRLLPTAASTRGTQQLIPVSTHIIRAKNPATPFANFSGCTAGYYEAQ